MSSRRIFFVLFVMLVAVILSSQLSEAAYVDVPDEFKPLFDEYWSSGEAYLTGQVSHQDLLLYLTGVPEGMDAELLNSLGLSQLEQVGRHYLPPNYIEQQAWAITESLEDVYFCRDEQSCQNQFQRVSDWTVVPAELKRNTLVAWGLKANDGGYVRLDGISELNLSFTPDNELVYKNAAFKLVDLKSRVFSSGLRSHPFQ